MKIYEDLSQTTKEKVYKFMEDLFTNLQTYRSDLELLDICILGSLAYGKEEEDYIVDVDAALLLTELPTLETRQDAYEYSYQVSLSKASAVKSSDISFIPCTHIIPPQYVHYKDGKRCMLSLNYDKSFYTLSEIKEFYNPKMGDTWL